MRSREETIDKLFKHTPDELAQWGSISVVLMIGSAVKMAAFMLQETNRKLGRVETFCIFLDSNNVAIGSIIFEIGSQDRWLPEPCFKLRFLTSSFACWSNPNYKIYCHRAVARARTH